MSDVVVNNSSDKMNTDNLLKAQELYLSVYPKSYSLLVFTYLAKEGLLATVENTVDHKYVFGSVDNNDGSSISVVANIESDKKLQEIADVLLDELSPCSSAKMKHIVDATQIICDINKEWLAENIVSILDEEIVKLQDENGELLLISDTVADLMIDLIDYQEGRVVETSFDNVGY